MIRVVTAAGKLTRTMESPYTLEVLQPPPTQVPSSASAGPSSKAHGRPAAASAKAYAFDFCAGPATSQAELFTLLDMPAMCDAALQGEVVTVFCFGQTGSGKTFTLSGRTLEVDEVTSPDGPLVCEDGLQYQAVAYIARRLKEMRHAARRRHKAAKRERKGGAEEDKTEQTGTSESSSLPTAAPSVVAKCSYVELYQETLYDLLQPDSAATVRCRWSAAAQAFYVEGSLLVECNHHDDFLMVLREGQRNRQRGSHALNRDSSRSHVVFTVFFDIGEGEEVDPPSTAVRSRRHGRLVFVDLAGSERLKKSQSTSGAETGSINKSLFTLGHVLELLSTDTTTTTTAAEGKPSQKPPFIPYRSSVLTQLLMHSLDGHGRTLMVACVSPSLRHLAESLRTLHYAQRARHIHTTPVVHVDAATQLRMALEAQVTALQRENALLRRAIGLPRTAPLTEADVYAQVEALRRVSGGGGDGVAPRTAAPAETAQRGQHSATSAAPVAATRRVPPRSRSTSSPLPPSAAAATKKLVGRTATVQHGRVRAAAHDTTAQSTDKRVASLQPAPAATASVEEEKDDSDAERHEDSAASLEVGNTKEAAPMNILALLDALPDTRSMS